MVDVLMLAMFGAVLAFVITDLLGVHGDRQVLSLMVGWLLFGVIGFAREHKRRPHA